MRELLNLLNYFTEAKKPGDDLGQLKNQIIGQVKKTDDQDLLEKIYTTLNKSGLADRIGLVLSRDTDTKAHVQELTNMIIDVPGTYDEKAEFVKGYPNGYVDIKRMLSGDYVTFDELLKGQAGAPMAFVKRVFDNLRSVTFGSAKGPGEFALAVLSPKIKITGRGDLNIDGKVIEVKASKGGGGGRIGTAGLLATDDIPRIINRYIPDELPASLNLKQLKLLMDAAGLTQAQQTKLCKELFTYIFRGKTDVSSLVRDLVSGKDPTSGFIKNSYEIYRQETDFDGMMLINFGTGALKYYTDPEIMARDIYGSTIYLISSNAGYQTRLILPPLTLRPAGGTAPDAPADAQPRGTRTTQPPVDLDQVVTKPRLTGPGAQAARKRQAPKMTTDVLGREKRRR
jgi:hypothetical protein